MATKGRSRAGAEPAAGQDNSLPLAGMRVIDFSTMVSGPLAGQMLGDLGADVVKVEPPGGDPLRFVRPFHEGIGALFLHTNRHKHSIELDMKADEGRQLALALARSADVVLENFRPGVMERLGLGYEILKQANPGLIYAAISGFGQSGPYTARPAYDHVIQGLTGVMLVPGYGDVPTPVHNVIVDKAAAMAAVNGILAALLARANRDGAGQRVDVSLLNAFAAFSLPEMMANVTFLAPGSDKRDPVGIYHPVKTSDGWVIGHVQTDQQFRAACEIFHRPDLIDDPRFQTMRDRARAMDQMWAEFAVTAAEIETAALVHAAERSSLPLGPINTVEEFIADPQAIHTRAHFIHDDPRVGPIRLLTYPAQFSETPARVEARAPLLGEHSARVAAAAGVDEAKFADLVAKGIIGAAELP